MAESFAYEIAGQILGKLTSLAVREIGQVWGVESEFNRLELTLSSIKAVLLDAAEQKKKNRQVEDWLKKLQDVLDDSGDLLDDFVTEDLRRKIVIKGSKRKEVSNFFSSSNPVALRVTMSHRLRDIRKRLDDISADRTNFQLIERTPNTTLPYPPREQTHSYVNAIDVIGRESDKKRIVELLLSSSSSSNSSSNQNLSVLPIVGLGGLGKTTLAKLVYNDDAIVSNFERRIWVCVSEDFDLKKLIEKIMKDATGGVDHAHLDLNQLQACLRTTLQSKKYLLVLDDVWNDDPKRWKDLKDLLICGGDGCKIVVTTRKENTAEIMRTFPPYKLKSLSEDECMSIFLNCAFREREDNQYPELVEIGKAIVMKCGGLPLAVKCMGSLLYTKREENDWRYVRDNDIWKYEHKENDVLPVLKLSYDEMPLHLKQCFAHCAKYPKDIEIPSHYLIAEWMAHGYIQPSDGNRSLEDIGNQYVHELSSRSFFQDVSERFIGDYILFKMHDLVHDLALSVAGEEVSHVKFDSASTLSERTRHVLLCEEQMEGKEFPDFLLRLKKVRSFKFQYSDVGLISKTYLSTFIKTFNRLRSLDLSGSEFEELPSSIGTLKHLRLLSIAGNRKIKELPNTISTLVNLQTLYLDDCVMLQDLPRDFGNLWSLRCLALTSQTTCFPKKGLLEDLTSLQWLLIKSCYHLESFSAGMQNLTALRYLYIEDCPSLTHLPSQCMRYLTSLEVLSIGRCAEFNFSEEEEEDAHKMMELQTGLLALELYDMPRLTELPRWFEKASSTIKCILIINCPSLRILPEWLSKCKSLSKLRIENCTLLDSLPLGMDQLIMLRTLHILDCSEELRRKCKKETGEYWPWISQIHEIELG